MQIVIDIPEDNIRVEYGEVRAIRSDKDILCNYIFHGTPLEKHDAEVLDKIRAEIEEHRNKTEYMDKYDLIGDCLDIIDKYKADMGDKE